MLRDHHSSRFDGVAPIKALPQYYADERGRAHFVDALFDHTARDYDRVERVLALGSGSRHRRQALRRAGLAPGMHVLDVATGTGLVAREALGIVGSRGIVVGLDPSAGMLNEANRAMTTSLVRGRGESLPFSQSAFDFVSMGFALRHVTDLDLLFSECHRVLKPGGTLCVLEISKPRVRLVAVSLRLFMTRLVPAIAGVSSRGSDIRRLMHFYWDTIDACVSPEEVLAALERSNFGSPEHRVSLGMFSEYVATKS
ncbi:MAG: class I SAM-dependent methyltransferase [Pseudomonadota bacterium]|nr:class I SAM-dependent methyltransferase [Pseudomonadota bacterium]